MKKAIIIRYCEIHLKGKNRGFFEKLLRENIKKSLKGIQFNFTSMHSRYLIEDFDDCDLEIIENKLRKIAGIHNSAVKTGSCRIKSCHSDTRRRVDNRL